MLVLPAPTLGVNEEISLQHSDFVVKISYLSESRDVVAVIQHEAVGPGREAGGVYLGVEEGSGWLKVGVTHGSASQLMPCGHSLTHGIYAILLKRFI